MNFAADPHSGALTGASMDALLRLAARAVDAAVRGAQLPRGARVLPEPSPGGGAFVTLHRHGALAGCIGFVTAPPPLEATVVRAARSAALEDPRFAPVTVEALPELDIEISVLSEPAPIAPEAICIGVHGLVLEHRGRRGLLLPQVATEHHLDRDGFLAVLCDKAMLPRGAWREPGACLSAFSAQVAGAPLPLLLQSPGAPQGGTHA